MGAKKSLGAEKTLAALARVSPHTHAHSHTRARAHAHKHTCPHARTLHIKAPRSTPAQSGCSVAAAGHARAHARTRARMRTRVRAPAPTHTCPHVCALQVEALRKPPGSAPPPDQGAAWQPHNYTLRMENEALVGHLVGRQMELAHSMEETVGVLTVARDQECRHTQGGRGGGVALALVGRQMALAHSMEETVGVLTAVRDQECRDTRGGTGGGVALARWSTWLGGSGAGTLHGGDNGCVVCGL